ncbi:MAG: hypothetical protein ABFD92_00015 [Planctomycetaceae bacterium]|nr:hypothetical protein [Planctomycetaceae bacterium]
MNASEVQAKIEQSVEAKWADFTAAHPKAAQILQERLGNPVELVCKAVEKDEQYMALQSDTAAELDMGRIGTIIGNVVGVVFDKVIAAAL